MASMSVHPQARAGTTALLTMFGQGNVLVLESRASGKTLRIINDGKVEGQGGHGKFAQFTVHVRRPEVVALQNVNNPDAWLGIIDGKLIGNSKGGPYSEFIVKEIDGKLISLESAMYPGKHVGILPDGTPKPPGNTGTGQHGRFVPILIKDMTSQMASMSVYPQARAGTTTLLTMFGQGNVLVLESRASGKTLRIITDGKVEGQGGRGKLAQFTVHVRRPEVVALQNVNNPDAWLGIIDGKLIGNSKGGPYSEFIVKEIDGKLISLESTMYPGKHVGILPDGTPKPPGNTGTGQHGRFVPILIKDMTSQMVSMSVHPQARAGTTTLLTMFGQGNVLVLESRASGKTLRIINDGKVEGRGGHGKLAQFTVHVRRPEVVALQNVNNPDAWLGIIDGKLIGNSKGGPYSEFIVKEIDGKLMSLESAMYPGKHVGILPDGTPKPPGNTGTGQHGRFVPILIKDMSLQMASMSIHPQARAGTTTLLTIFGQGNVLVLESCASGKTLRIINDGKVEGQGGHGKFAQFTIHVRRPEVVALQNVNNPDVWLGIIDGKLIGNSKGGPYSEFIVKEIDGKLISLESAMYPGKHVGILPDGTPKPPGNTGTGQHGRFVPILIKDMTSQMASMSIHPQARAGTTTLLTMFGQGNVLVLESRASGKTLRIINDGKVEGQGGRGKLAQFTVHVRRPEVVALQNVNNPDAWLGIIDGKLIGNSKGGPYSEFIVKEIDGKLISLESTMYPGKHVGILPDGTPKPPGNTGTGQHGRFVPILIKDMTSQMASTSVHPQARAGTTTLLAMFGQGNVLVLESRASGKTLRIINDGKVEGRGGRGKFAQFTVHVRRPEVVALQNVNDPDAWLGIIDGKLIGNLQSKGGPYSEFIVKEIDGNLISLESAMYPGKHVGILPDGTPKPPGNTGTGQHGRFVPILIKDASSSPPTDQWPLSGGSAAVVAGAAAIGAATGAAAAGGGPPLYTPHEVPPPYSPHEVPPQGMLPQGMPPQGMPPQWMLPQEMPPQGMLPQGMLPQGMPPQGMPPQGMPPQGMPPQGMLPQEIPPQGVLPQGKPPQQGYPPATYPQGGYPPISQPGYPPAGQSGYPPATYPQGGYPPVSQPGYPPAGQPGYPPVGQLGYPPQAGYPGYQQQQFQQLPSAPVPQDP